MNHSKLKNNIPLMYVILGLDNALFWIAIWVLFYLRFTNYAGIGLIESVMIFTAFIAEVPTGAIADLFGKKGALIMAFLLGAISNVLMGVAPGFSVLLISVFIMTIGGALRSGTAEALIYDTLLSLKREGEYEKILANHSTIKMLTIAVSSIVGGLLYSLNPGLPFIILGLFKLLALGLSLFLIEPPIDTEKFNWQSYFRQTKLGFWELFRNKSVAVSSFIVILLTTITLINGHFLIDAQLIAQGWDEKALGVISAAMFLLSASMAQLTAVLSGRWGKQLANLVAAVAIVLTMLAIPWLGIIVATLVIMSRNGFLEIFGNTANSIINQNVRSQYRATALSAYSMLSSAPYVLTAFAIGLLIDRTSVNSVAFVLGIILLVFVSVGFLVRKKTVAALSV